MELNQLYEKLKESSNNKNKEKILSFNHPVVNLTYEMPRLEPIEKSMYQKIAHFSLSMMGKILIFPFVVLWIILEKISELDVIEIFEVFIHPIRVVWGTSFNIYYLLDDIISPEFRLPISPYTTLCFIIALGMFLIMIIPAIIMSIVGMLGVILIRMIFN